jgi:hypothetical protein
MRGYEVDVNLVDQSKLRSAPVEELTAASDDCGGAHRDRKPS